MKNSSDQRLAWIGRGCAYLLLVSSVLNLVLSIKYNNQSFLILYSVIRLLFISCAIVFAGIRRVPRYYVAGFHEMSEALYWHFVIAIMNAFTLVLLYFSVDLSPALIDANAASIVAFLLSILLLYQTKPWTHAEQQQRLERIRRLAKKAHLSKDELALLAPTLADAAQAEQRTPRMWRIAKWVTVVILGVLFNMYASVVVNFFTQIDVFRPFLGK